MRGPRRRILERAVWAFIGAAVLSLGLILTGQWEPNIPTRDKLGIGLPDTMNWIDSIFEESRPKCEDVREREERMLYDWLVHRDAPSYEEAHRLERDLADYCNDIPQMKKYR